MPLPSAVILPALRVKTPAADPDAITMLAGTVINGDPELTFTVVLVAAGCDKEMVHEAVPPDITPVGLQATAVTTNGALKGAVSDCDDPL